MAAISTATNTDPASHATTKFVSAAKNTTPAANPSSPSIRFTALMIPTIHSTVTGNANTPIDRSPSSGNPIASIRKPHAKANDAAAICAYSLYKARIPRTSSAKPSAHIPRAPTNTPTTRHISPRNDSATDDSTTNSPTSGARNPR